MAQGPSCSKFIISKNSFRNTIRVLSSVDPDQAYHFVRPGLGPNCLLGLGGVGDRQETQGDKELKSPILT